MSGRPWREDWAGHAGVVGVVAAILVLVVMAVFLYLVPLSRGETVAYLAPRPAATATAADRSASAAPAGASPAGVGSAAVLPSPVSQAAPVKYVDARYGFELALPDGWRQAKRSDAERPAMAADYDVVWEDPASGARLAASVWEAGEVTSFLLWSALQGSGMTSVDGQVPYNAVVAGQPAVLMASAESPAAPTRYALFFERAGRFYRVDYAALDGGAAISDYARALATLRWPEDAPSAAVVPLRGLPGGRFWPSQQLFGR